jgi:hypothetical protein
MPSITGAALSRSCSATVPTSFYNATAKMLPCLSFTIHVYHPVSTNPGCDRISWSPLQIIIIIRSSNVLSGFKMAICCIYFTSSVLRKLQNSLSCSVYIRSWYFTFGLSFLDVKQASCWAYSYSKDVHVYLLKRFSFSAKGSTDPFFLSQAITVTTCPFFWIHGLCSFVQDLGHP